MKYVPDNKSCENCLYFDEEDVTEVMIVYPAVDCLFLHDAKGLTFKDRKKIQKALVRYNTNQSHPYCKFWIPNILKTKSHNDIRKKATDFVESRLSDSKR